MPTGFSHLYEAGKAAHQSFLISTGKLTLPAADAFTCWFRNDSPIYDLVVAQCEFCWNGGNTNHNRTVICTLWDGTSVPNARANPLVPEPLAGGPSHPAPVTAFVWSGSGSGMGVADPGVEVAAGVFGKGCTGLPVLDGLILAEGDVVACRCKPEEIGTGSFLCFVFLVPKNSLV